MRGTEELQSHVGDGVDDLTIRGGVLFAGDDLQEDSKQFLESVGADTVFRVKHSLTASLDHVLVDRVELSSRGLVDAVHCFETDRVVGVFQEAADGF